jgi:hypothetical protein
MSSILSLIDPTTGEATTVTREVADATIGGHLTRGENEVRVRTYPAQGTRNAPSSAPVTVMFVRTRRDASLVACLEITDAAYPAHNTES